jgi:hypothetical protein
VGKFLLLDSIHFFSSASSSMVRGARFADRVFFEPVYPWFDFEVFEVPLPGAF